MKLTYKNNCIGVIGNILLALILILGTNVIWGVYHEAYSGCYSAGFAGTITKYPLADNMFLSFIFFDKVWGWLYLHFTPKVPWFEATFLLLYFGGLLFWFIVIDEIQPNKTHCFLNKVLSFILIYAIHLVENNPTRTTFILSSSTCLFVFVEYNYHQFKRLSAWFVYIVAFTCICLIRIEAVMITTAIFIIFVCCLYLNTNSLKIRALLPLLFFPLLLAIIFITVIRHQNDNWAIKEDSKLIFLSDGGGNFSNIRTGLNSEKDKLIFEAINNWIIYDPPNITTAEINSLSDYVLNSFRNNKILFLQNRMLNTYSNLTNHFIDNPSAYITLFCFFVLSFVVSPTYYKIRLSFFLVSVGFLVFGIVFFTRSDDRALGSILSVSSLYLFFFLIHNYPIKNYFILFSPLIIITFIQLNCLKENFKNEKIMNLQLIEKIKIIKIKYLVLTGPASEIFNVDFGKQADFGPDIIIIPYDWGQLPFSNEWQKYLKKTCSCDIKDFSTMYRFINNHKEESIIVSTPTFIDLTTRYLKDIHHLDLNFQKSLKSEHPFLNCYKIR